MLPGPIFRHELKAAARRRDLFVVRIVLAVLLGAVALAVLYGYLRIERDRGRDDPEVLQWYARVVFAIGMGIELAFLALLPVAAVSPSIAQEREKDTLPLLLLTRLTRLELVLTKLAGRLMPSFLLILTGLPLLLVSGRLAHVPVLVLIEVHAVLITTAIVAGSLAILASARHERTGSAGGEAMAWTMVWLMGLPMVSLLPVRSGTLWGDLLIELRRLAAWIAPSSPGSLLAIGSRLSVVGFGALSDRLVTMLVLQPVVIVLALGAAVACLRLREPHPHSWDPHRGYRPPVGDDPIFWREYVLPWRGNRLPIIVLLARQMLIVLRAVLLMLLQLLALALAVSVPIGLVIAAGWFGYFAARELWEHGYGSFASGPFQARDHLNLFIRGVTGVLGLAPLLIEPAGMTNRFTIERDKKTWEPLLTTPLTGPEILAAKLRVTVRSLWPVGRWLIALWVLGLACDALHPLGVLIAAVELLLAVWAGLALGTWLGLRPGSTTQAATSASALWSLGLMLLGGLWVVAPLCSPRELAQLRARDDRLFWLALVVLLAAALTLGTVARFLTRRCFRCFDEWVGRPHRAAGPRPESGDRAGAGLPSAEPGTTALPPYRLGMANEARASVE